MWTLAKFVLAVSYDKTTPFQAFNSYKVGKNVDYIYS